VGIFGGGSAQDDVDLREVQERLARVESALASLQQQVASLTTGAIAAGGSVPYAGNPNTTSDGALPAGGEWLAEVRALKESGKVINAIKLYRQRTGVGLKEAKDAVEGML
jgi:large subunit ribosomal protein L7/L12